MIKQNGDVVLDRKYRGRKSIDALRIALKVGQPIVALRKTEAKNALTYNQPVRKSQCFQFTGLKKCYRSKRDCSTSPPPGCLG